VFGLLPKIDSIAATPLIISIFADGEFLPFMDDYISRFIDFDSFFEFLYKKYFSRIAFRLVYLSEQKTKAFGNTQTLLALLEVQKDLDHQYSIRNRF
jgi:hypothetical protein